MLNHVVSHQTKSHTRQNFTLRRYIALKISPLLCGGSKVRHGNWHNFSPGLLWPQKTKSTYVYFVFLAVLVIEIQMFFEWFEGPTSATQAQPASSPCSNCSQLFFHLNGSFLQRGSQRWFPSTEYIWARYDGLIPLFLK